MKVSKLLALGALPTLLACGGAASDPADAPGGPDAPVSGPAAPAEPTMLRYSGPGSFYDVSMAPDGTFVIDISETLGAPVVISVQGTYERLDSGFLRLTVTQASGPAGQAPAPGDQAYALEVPGFAMFLRPMQGNELIPMLVRGACPTADFRANWAMAQTTEMRDASRADREWFGTFFYEHGATPRASVDGRYSLATLSPLADAARPIEVGGCEDGLLQVLGDGEVIANMWLTDGGAMVESMNGGQRLQTIFAMRQQPVQLADVAGDYAALVFVDGEEGSTMATASIDAAGQGVGMAFDPVAEADLDGEGAMRFSLERADHPAMGWLTGRIDGSDSQLACSTQASAAGRILLCIGQDPSEPSRSVTMVMVAR